MSDRLLLTLLAPVAAAQGLRLRITLKPAPPATGPARGTVRTRTSSGPPLRIVVLGDSTAAQAGRSVDWHAIGQPGATSRRIRYRLLPRLDEELGDQDPLDVAVLLAGGNDVLSGRGPGEWRTDLSAIVEALLARADRVIVAAIPPFALFPAMPTALGRHLGHRAAALDAVSQEVCAAHERATWVAMQGVPTTDFFAADRFHPSAAGYQKWAEGIAGRLVTGITSRGLTNGPGCLVMGAKANAESER